MSDANTLSHWIQNFPNVRLLCVGDAMVDHFIKGTVDRISPEAPVPVFHIQGETATLGGSANVVRNISDLGGYSRFISVVGEDETGHKLESYLNDTVGVTHTLLKDPNRPTINKTRYVVDGHQLLRVDDESVHPIPVALEDQIFKAFEEALPQCQGVILSDYGKGVLSPGLCQRLIKHAKTKDIPVIVDPKGHEYDRYSGATLLTPNRRELKDATLLPVGTLDQVKDAGRSLLKKIQVDYLLVTLGGDGMMLFNAKDPQNITHISALALEVFDVSGAGDTVIATLSMALTLGAPLDQAMDLANIAAGIVVGKLGTATVSSQDLLKVIEADQALASPFTLEESLEIIEEWRAQGLKIGFTNGCFDVLHAGHVTYLTQARSKCDRLIVGLNTDESVAKLKGPTRPVNILTDRMLVLNSLNSVDLVIPFEEDTPLELIQKVVPDLLIKAADYKLEDVVGAPFVLDRGGKVYLAPLVEGLSTTNTISKLKA